MREERRTRAAVEALAAELGPGPWLLGSVRQAGWTDRQIRRAVDAGRLARPFRGVVALPAADTSLDQARAALLVAGPRATASHESAADAHSLWLPRDASDLVHITDPGAPDRTDHGMRIHGSRLPERHVVTLDGVRVTSIARTAVDLARGRELPEAMVVVDSAARALIAASGVPDLRVLREAHVRARLMPLAVVELQEAFADVWTWPGTVVARAAIDLVDPAAESPLESRSRGWMHAARLPSPLTACPVQGASGAWYVADFAWPGVRVLGEADGVGKYGNDPSETAKRLRAERRRQRDLEDDGWLVVRWDSSEPARTVVNRVARALQR
jgi:hypothetical protein